MSEFTTARLSTLMGIDFSSDQLDAITAPLAPAVIMAGAGSGKTAVMTARVVWLVATQGIEPQGVLGLTFTNKAAGEFRTRVRSALAMLDLPPEAADAATVTTYHAFAQQLLIDDGIRIGLEPEVQLLSDVRREQLAMQVIRHPEIDITALSHSSKSTVARLLALDDRLAEEAVDIDAVRTYDEALIARLLRREQQATGLEIIATSRKRLELLGLVGQFRALKLRSQCIDYADMVRLALRLVEERADVMHRLRTQYPVVLLDEYQDTSVAQRLLMQRAFSSEHAITAVGDALQAIYEWRGASAINIVEFPRHFGRETASGALIEAPVFGLPTTQRFGSHIARAANDITESLRADLRHVYALQSQSDERFGPGRIDVALHADEAAEFAWIAQQLLDAHHTTEWKDMAVLLRQHRHSAGLYEALSEAGVPVQIVGKRALLQIPDVADLVAYLRVVHDPAANPSWVRILAGMRYRFGQRDIAHLGRRALEISRVDHSDGWEAALANAAAGSDSVDLVAIGDAIADPGDRTPLSNEARVRVAELHAEISQLRRLAGQPIAELVRAVVQRIGLDVEIEASDRAVARGRRGALESFVELVAGFSSLDGSHSLTSFLRWLDDGDRLDRQATIEHPVSRNAVSVMTVHAAKGLQRDVIVLPALVEGVFPSNRSDAAWTGSADALPFEVLKTDVDPLLRAYPSDYPRSVDRSAFMDALKPRKLAEETRLAYVAVTRAQRRLIATASRSYGGKEFEPSRYLVQLRDAALLGAGAVHVWTEAAETAFEAPVIREPWPQELEPTYARLLADTAARVLTGTAAPTEPTPLSDEHRAMLAIWDAAIDHHAAERQHMRRVRREVPLPVSLSTTQAQFLARDPDAFLLDLVRPMPQKPAVAAKRGSAFHAWLEQQFGQQLLFGETSADDGSLAELQAAFLDSEWSGRTPLELELPFVIGVGRFCIRGRIDAIYREGDELVVVDWKTNARTSSDPLQLSVYCHAAAAHFGVPIDRVRACFVYVAQRRTEWHAPVTDLSELAASIFQQGAEPMLDGPTGDGHA